MNLKRLIPLLFILILYNTGTLAEDKKDCSLIESDTAVKTYEKWKCKKGIPEDESFGTTLKKLFKKKN